MSAGLRDERLASGGDICRAADVRGSGGLFDHEDLMKALKRMWLQYLLASDEQYLMACKRDGLISSIDVTAFERRMQAMRVELATLAPRFQGVPQ